MKNLSILRKQKGLSQTELGKLLNISQVAISKYENGESEPDLITLKKLTTIFNCSISTLLDIEENDMIIISKQDYKDLKNICNRLSTLTNKIETTNQSLQITNNIENNYGEINIGTVNKNK